MRLRSEQQALTIHTGGASRPGAAPSREMKPLDLLKNPVSICPPGLALGSAGWCQGPSIAGDFSHSGARIGQAHLKTDARCVRKI
jgi:hypothetical protein